MRRWTGAGEWEWEHFCEQSRIDFPIRWSTIENGELLALAAKEFDVFVTIDRNLSLQQDLPAFDIAVIVLRSRSNRLADPQVLVPTLLAAIPTAKRSIATYVPA